MKKTMLFLYFIVSLFPTSLDKFQALMVNKQFDVHGIFYKYDFANIESAWDFVYVADNVYHQLKGDKATSNNIFGWKIIDEVVVSDPSFYFVYLFDIDEDNQTKYDWVALDKKASTINKIVGSTNKGYFAWSDTLNKLSFSFSKDNKKVTFHKAIDGGSSTDGQQLPKFPDLPDRLLDVGDTGNNPNTDDNKTDDDTKDDTKKDDDKTDDKKKDDDTKDDTKKDDSNTNDDNCTSYVDDFGDRAPSPGVCLRKK